MKLYIYILVLIADITMLANKAFTQNNSNGFTITCTFNGLPDKTKVYLTNQERDTIHKTLSNGNKVVFTGELERQGRFHFIKFDTLLTSIGTQAIFVSHKPISVYGILGQSNIEVFGSEEQREYDEARTSLFKNFEKKMNEYAIEMSTKIKEINNIPSLSQTQKDSLARKVADQWSKKEKVTQTEFSTGLARWLIEHNTSLFAPYVMRSSLSIMTPQHIRETYSAFSDRVKESYYGHLLKTDIEALTTMQGSLIPNFPLKNLEGKIENLYDLIKVSNYTLIDCWASWCSPCRAEIPKLKIIYEKYKNKGLNIIGISSDKKEIDWKKAVAEDKTTWSQVSEVDGNLTKSFGLNTIPAYILVDKEGKIVAFDCAISKVPNFGGSLRKEALEKKLEELLGK